MSDRPRKSPIQFLRVLASGTDLRDWILSSGGSTSLARGGWQRSDSTSCARSAEILAFNEAKQEAINNAESSSVDLKPLFTSASSNDNCFGWWSLICRKQQYGRKLSAAIAHFAVAETLQLRASERFGLARIQRKNRHICAALFDHFRASVH